jgi:general secretion pathway protein H
MSGAGSSPGPRRRAREGFTAIELMVALGVLALLAGLAAPLFSVVADAVRFRTAARALAADLREARGAALRGGAPVALAFDPEGRGYGIAGAARWVSLPEELALRWQPGPFAPDATTLGFFPDGSATGGALWLAGPRHVAGIAIEPLTGRFATLLAPPPQGADAEEGSR